MDPEKNLLNFLLVLMSIFNC